MNEEIKTENSKRSVSQIKRLRAVTALIAVVLLLPLCVLAFAEFFVPDQYVNTFTAELPDKYNRLYGINEPKIVVIGGSSVAFALDSKLMEELTGMPTANFGLYASIGTRAMMELSRDAINPGDIIILSPETDNQTMSMYFGAETMWQATEKSRGILKKLPADMLKEMALYYWDYASSKCRLWMTGTPDPEGVYRKDSFNEYCDISYSRPQSKMKLGYDPSKIINPSPETIDKDFVSFLNDYTSDAIKRGAKVYFTFCPMNSKAMVNGVNEESLYDYFLYLSSVLKCRTISDIHNSIMDAGYFYDSNFHLNDSGKIVWTTNLATDIMRANGVKNFKADVELPPPPELPKDSFDPSYDSNSEYFTYRESRDDKGDVSWYSVSGLSEEGLKASSLTLPKAYNGLPVRGIDANAFAQSKILKSVTVNDNISFIESGAFASCPTLDSLHILCENADDITVDQVKLFDGEVKEIKIYLYSKSSYQSFVAGYFWANYGNRMVYINK